MTQTQPIEFTIVGPTGAGLYPSTSRFVDLLFGEGGAWGYENSFGAPQKIFSCNLPIDPAAAPAVILQTWDGIRVLSVCTHHGEGRKGRRREKGTGQAESSGQKEMRKGQVGKEMRKGQVVGNEKGTGRSRTDPRRERGWWRI